MPPPMATAQPARTPPVRPGKRISTVSLSWRWVTYFDVPGLRASSQGWMSAAESGIPGGQPSTTPPIAGPWDSPQVVMRKMRPVVLTLMAAI